MLSRDRLTLLRFGARALDRINDFKRLITTLVSYGQTAEWLNDGNPLPPINKLLKLISCVQIHSNLCEIDFYHKLSSLIAYHTTITGQYKSFSCFFLPSQSHYSLKFS